LALPFTQAVATGEGYYLVWPKKRLNPQPVALLYHFLLEHIPAPFPDGLTRLGQPPK
ncbi:TPA: LysR family transcriptional regulator, partial [Raoultella ornithinolytica]|nr:LysR family transcriptional regulator [Raoultella ornithinolytica]